MGVKPIDAGRYTAGGAVSKVRGNPIIHIQYMTQHRRLCVDILDENRKTHAYDRHWTNNTPHTGGHTYIHRLLISLSGDG